MSIITEELKRTMRSMNEKLEKIKTQKEMNEATTNDILKEIQKVFEGMVNEFPEYCTMGSVDEDKNHTILLLNIQDRGYKFEAIENKIHSARKNSIDIYFNGSMINRIEYLEEDVADKEGWHFTEMNFIGKVIKSKEDLHEHLNKMLQEKISKIKIR